MNHWFEVSFYRLLVGLITEYYPQTNLLTLEDVFVFLLVICDSISSPSKLVFPSIFSFLGFYRPSSAHISSKEDLHVFLALTKSWKRGQFWCSSLHPTHNACFNFLWIKSSPKLLDFLAFENTFQALWVFPTKESIIKLEVFRILPSPLPPPSSKIFIWKVCSGNLCCIDDWYLFYCHLSPNWGRNSPVVSS